LPLNKLALMNVSDNYLQLLRIDDYSMHKNSENMDASPELDYAMLIRRFPKLKFIEITGRKYNCSYFTKVTKVLKKGGITLFLRKEVTVGNQTTVYGLVCAVNDIVDRNKELRTRFEITVELLADVLVCVIGVFIVLIMAMQAVLTMKSGMRRFWNKL
jgi:hypothetical protein